MSITADLKRPGDRVLARLVALPARSRVLWLGIIAVLVLLVGWFDWITATRISLMVFYLLPIGLAVAWLGTRSALAVAAGSVGVKLAGDLLPRGQHLPSFWIFWNALISLGGFLIVIWILAEFRALHASLERRVVERTRELEKSIEERRRVERELREAGLRERAEIGRELHDDVCQHLVATSLAARVLGERLGGNPGGIAGDVKGIVSLLEEGIGKTRDVARGLLLARINPADLPHELAALAGHNVAPGVFCRFMQDGNPLPEDAAAAAQLFRIAQEAVRNAIRHARPTRVDILLTGDGETLRLEIVDDGVGFPSPPSDGGMGMRVMANRAAVIGSEFSVIPAPGGGTRVICEVRKPRATAPPLAP